MSRTRQRQGFLGAPTTVVLGLLIACSDVRPPAPSPGPPPKAGTAALGGDRVASIGRVPITVGLAKEVALARKLSPREAVDTLVEEALLAEAAIRKGALADPEVQRKLRAMMARGLVARYRAEALAAGPWTDAELDAAARGTGLWVDLDRPETRTAVHALVRNGVPGQADLIRKLRDQLVSLPATGTIEEQAKAFLAMANAFALPTGHTVVAERLDDPFALDGRVAAKGPPRGLEVPFCKGAFAVAAAGQTSEIVETTYGLHVIRVLTIRPPHLAPREERVRILEPDLLAKRVGPRFGAKVTELFEAAQPTMSDLERLLLPRVAEPPR